MDATLGTTIAVLSGSVVRRARGRKVLFDESGNTPHSASFGALPAEVLASVAADVGDVVRAPCGDRSVARVTRQDGVRRRLVLGAEDAQCHEFADLVLARVVERRERG